MRMRILSRAERNILISSRASRGGFFELGQLVARIVLGVETVLEGVLIVPGCSGHGDSLVSRKWEVVKVRWCIYWGLIYFANPRAFRS